MRRGYRVPRTRYSSIGGHPRGGRPAVSRSTIGFSGAGPSAACRLVCFLAAIVVGLAVPVFFILADIEIVAYHRAPYQASFAANGTPASLGLTQDQLWGVMRRVLDYSTGHRADLQFDWAAVDGGSPGRPAFGQRELDHMVDVRALFALGSKVRWAALAAALVGTVLVFVLLRPDRRRALGRLASGLILGSALSMLAWGVLAFAVLRGFGDFWTTFHETLFTNDLWLLPVNSLLIRMLPEDLFRRLALEIVGLFTLETIVVLVMSAVVLRRNARPRRPGPLFR